MGASAGPCRPLCLEACPHAVTQDGITSHRKSRSISGSDASIIDRVSSVTQRVIAGDSTDLIRLELASMFTSGHNLSLELQQNVAEARTGVSRAFQSPDDNLRQGAQRGDLRRVQRAIEAGAELGKANPRGVTPLMLAASSSGSMAVEVVEELLSKEADIADRDHQGWTALHHACRNGKTEVSRKLIAAKADMALHTADHRTPLVLATIEGKVDLIKELVKNREVREQVGEKDALGATALHFAVKDGSVEVTKLLLEHGAKVNAKDIDGKMPLTWACEHGKLECARLLARRSADIDGRDKSQKTPLLYACTNSYEGVALWLMKKGADPKFRDLHGDSPLIIADENGLSEFKRAIKQRRMEQEEAFE